MTLGVFQLALYLLSLVVPWLLGGAWVLLMLRRSGEYHHAIVIGHGYLVGVFLTTLLIRAWDASPLALSFAGILAVLTAAALLGTYLNLRRDDRRFCAPAVPGTATWQTVILALVVILIGLRLLNLAQEIVLRPLFPWDAWMNWAPKAIVWFHYGELVPFVSPSDWLGAPASSHSYTEGAGKAWQYPPTLGLLQLWHMLALGTSDHTLVYLPWLFCGSALGLTLYGHLRLAGASRLTAAVASYGLLSIPFLDTHIALAGYADLWVAAAFGGAVFSLYQFQRCGHWSYGLLALFLALLCSQLKIPGLIMGAVIVLGMLAHRISLSRYGLLLLAATAPIAVALLMKGVDFNLPELGRISISTRGIALPYLGEYAFSYHNIHRAMLSTLFLVINWHLLWYLFTAVLVYYLARVSREVVFRADIFCTVTGLLFILFVYYFSDRYEFALDHTQVNRALLYLVPGITFLLAHAIAEQFHPDGA